MLKTYLKIICLFLCFSCFSEASLNRKKHKSQRLKEKLSGESRKKEEDKFKGKQELVPTKDQVARTQTKFQTLWKDEKQTPPFKVEVLAEGLGIPWGMRFINKEELLWTEKKGAIKKIHIRTGQISSLSGGPSVYTKGQGGLLDVILHPDFAKNRKIYFTYSIQKKEGQSTALARGFLQENKITDLKTLFVAQPFRYGRIHFGSRLAFDEKGFLFMTVGDRGNKKSAQSLKTHLGKLLRLTEEGKAAKDNPFTKVQGAKPEIWSFGHRNPQGLFFHPETKELWLQEHGPRGGDEINLIKRGANYGWPVITYGRAYSGLKIGEGTHKKGLEQPIKYWTPSIAPCGLLIYSGKVFSQWKGDFFSGSLVLTHLNKLKISDQKVISEKRLLSPLGFRFRHVIEGPDGFIYVSVDQGMILKIAPLRG